MSPMSAKNGTTRIASNLVRYLVKACSVDICESGNVQSASFYKKPISNDMLRNDNDTTERGSAMYFDNGRLKLR